MLSVNLFVLLKALPHCNKRTGDNPHITWTEIFFYEFTTRHNSHCCCFSRPIKRTDKNHLSRIQRAHLQIVSVIDDSQPSNQFSLFSLTHRLTAECVYVYFGIGPTVCEWQTVWITDWVGQTRTEDMNKLIICITCAVTLGISHNAPVFTKWWFKDIKTWWFLSGLKFTQLIFISNRARIL